jgi:hypothetical protein
MTESKKFGSFDDEEWYDEEDKFTRVDDMGDDFDDEEFDDFDSFSSKHGHDTKWFGKGDSGRKMFDTYKDKHSKPFKVRTRRGMNEQDMASGHSFVGMNKGGDKELLTRACQTWSRYKPEDKKRASEWTKKITGTKFPYSMDTACASNANTVIGGDRDRKILNGIINLDWM